MDQGAFQLDRSPEGAVGPLVFGQRPGVWPGRHPLQSFEAMAVTSKIVQVANRAADRGDTESFRSIVALRVHRPGSELAPYVSGKATRAWG